MKKARGEENSVGRKQGREENREGKARREESRKGRKWGGKKTLGEESGKGSPRGKKKAGGKKTGSKGLTKHEARKTIRKYVLLIYKYWFRLFDTVSIRNGLVNCPPPPPKL